MATLITPDGKLTKIEPINGESFSIDELYEHIGCSLVQVCEHRDPNKIIIFDEEFLCRGDIVRHYEYGIAVENRDENGKHVYRPWLNNIATQAMHPRLSPFVHNVICGNAVVCLQSQFE